MVSRRELHTMLGARDLGLTSISDRGHSSGTCRKTATRRSSPPTAKEVPGDEQLLPGIPNEITLDLVAPKLSWRALPVLSSVSRAWEEAIRTNRDRIYAERVRANSTETLIIHNHVHNDRGAVALYSASENCCYELPPLLCLTIQVLEYYKCIALGGKIYILGGRKFSGGDRVLEGGHVLRDSQLSQRYLASGEVYVLDLSRRQWKWEQCASMVGPRYSFGCGVIDYKIYVFGSRIPVSDNGYPSLHNLLRSEVYDTQKNAWSPIMPMKQMIPFGINAIAAPVGKEFFLYDGNALTFRVYNPAKDEWRSLERFWGKGFPTLVFVAEGKIYSFSQSGIDVYDVEQNSWINRHTNSFAGLQPDDSTTLLPLAILAAKDELFLTANIGQEPFPQSWRCKGFYREKTEMVWQKTNCSFAKSYQRAAQFPFQL